MVQVEDGGRRCWRMRARPEGRLMDSPLPSSELSRGNPWYKRLGGVRTVRSST